MPDPLLHSHTLPNGLTLLAEHMPHVRSATMYLLAPAGFTREPADRLGLATVYAELLERGAGDRDTEQLTDALDNLGADRSISVGPFNVVASAGTLDRNIPAVLAIYADIFRRPHLPEDELEPARDLAMQDLVGLDDSPQDIALLDLKRRFYPPPYGRNRYGTADGLKAVTVADVTAHHAAHVKPNRVILSVAGNVDWPRLKAQVEDLFGDWAGEAVADASPRPHVPFDGHIEKDTQQTQIALAFPAAAFGTPQFIPARGAVGVLSGGMSARLFTEVREKRGLCYSVSASHDNVKDRAAVVCYAGTRADRAQQTLDVTVAELRKLKDGIADEEIDRVKAALKTALVMQQESTGARAAGMASDWFHLGRVRTPDEVQASVDALTPAAVLGYLDTFPVTDITLVTVGPQPLARPE